MINAILIDDEGKARKVLENKIREFCPAVSVIASVDSADTAYEAIQNHKPDLVFLDIAMPGESGFDLLKRLPNLNFELIFVTGFNDYAVDAIKFCAIGYILKPIQNEELIMAIHHAQKRIEVMRENERNKHFLQNMTSPGNLNNRIGIPTMEGLEFVATNEIIRCEGLQKYTKVFITEKKNIVSSYNLGEFRKLLEQYGFFCTHKSHLINLLHIKKYNKEGTVVMIDDSTVPVAKRKKSEFLEQLTRI